MGQYKTLIDQLEQAVNDYFELSKKIREMHEEVCTLKEELIEAVAKSCKEAPECKFAVK
jgi:dihydroneopterin aldolase